MTIIPSLLAFLAVMAFVWLLDKHLSRWVINKPIPIEVNPEEIIKLTKELKDVKDSISKLSIKVGFKDF